MQINKWAATQQLLTCNIAAMFLISVSFCGFLSAPRIFSIQLQEEQKQKLADRGIARGFASYLWGGKWIKHVFKGAQINNVFLWYIPTGICLVHIVWKQFFISQKYLRLSEKHLRRENKQCSCWISLHLNQLVLSGVSWSGESVLASPSFQFPTETTNRRTHACHDKHQI